VDKLKLIKLIYLSEREYLNRYLMPMTLDEFYSMKNGPIASSTLNGIDGELDASMWAEWIKLDGNKTSAVKMRNRNEFDHLSAADVDVMDSIWEQFGGLSTSRIWDYVHTKLREYKEVDEGRRAPISYKDMLLALEKEGADEIDQDISRLKQSLARIEA